jgi:hypothetical protein
MPNGWTFRERFPYYDGPFPEFLLEHEDGASHRYRIDRAFFTASGAGYASLQEWIDEVTNAAKPLSNAAKPLSGDHDDP